MTALHGFLGLPSDWDSVIPASELKVTYKPSWMKELEKVPASEANAALPQLARRLNEQAAFGSDVLLGYSMGGRIALHMLLDGSKSHPWRRAIIVSASPGIASEAERANRLTRDRKWAERFQSEGWDSLMESWQSQAVFDADAEVIRAERDFDRWQLADCVSRGSVGLQRDLRPALSLLEIPVLWVAGERDEKYCALATECAGLNQRFELAILPEAGHRAPWSRPEQFWSVASEFIQK